MRKMMMVGLALVAIGAAGVLLARSVHAQAGGSIVGVPALMSGGSRVGVAVRDVETDDLARAGLDEPRGVVVEAVTPDSPADRAGLQAGDVILEFDGARVRSVRQFTRLVQDTPAGRSVAAAVMRGGARQSVEIMPEAARPSGNLIRPEIRREMERRLRDLPRALDDLDLDVRRMFAIPRVRLGVVLTPLSDQLASYFGVSAGVLVSEVRDDSVAADAGIRAGDVITTIGDRTVEEVQDVRDALSDAKPGATLELGLVRDRQSRTLTVAIPERETPRRPVI